MTIAHWGKGNQMKNDTINKFEINKRQKILDWWETNIWAQKKRLENWPWCYLRRVFHVLPPTFGSLFVDVLHTQYIVFTTIGLSSLSGFGSCIFVAVFEVENACFFLSFTRRARNIEYFLFRSCVDCSIFHLLAFLLKRELEAAQNHD